MAAFTRSTARVIGGALGARHRSCDRHTWATLGKSPSVIIGPPSGIGADGAEGVPEMWPTELGTKGDSARGRHPRADADPLRTPSALLELLDRQAGRCTLCAEGLVVAPNAPDALTGVI